MWDAWIETELIAQIEKGCLNSQIIEVLHIIWLQAAHNVSMQQLQMYISLSI